MPTPTRRALLVATGVTLGSLAGCTSSLRDDDPPAGTLRFRNDHTLPHSVTIEVTDVGSRIDAETNSVAGEAPEVPPNERQLTASSTLQPDDVQTFTDAFTHEAWYEVVYTVDGRRPESPTVQFNPNPPERDFGTFLAIRIAESGRATWTVRSTDDTGRVRS